MPCRYLEYHDPESFDAAAPRAYCSVTDEFVQPMRADICNDRYDLDHATHCEIFRAALAETAPETETNGDSERDAQTHDEPDGTTHDEPDEPTDTGTDRG